MSRRGTACCGAAWVRGRPLARAGRGAHLVLLSALALVGFSSPAGAQPVTWEALPQIREYSFDLPFQVDNVGFIRGEGADASDPAADSLIAFTADGTFLYNPSGAAGAAGSNGTWDGWKILCRRYACHLDTGIATVSNTLITGVINNGESFCRATRRGRDWSCGVDQFYVDALHESALPFPESSSGLPALFVGSGPSIYSEIRRSFEDGAPGSWVMQRAGLNDFIAFGEVPPSPMLPRGRLIAAVFDGALYADDGGLTWHQSNLNRPDFNGPLSGVSIAFLPAEGHPYGGVAFAGMYEWRLEPGPSGQVYRSDDGGATWTLLHLFTNEETGVAPVNGVSTNTVQLLATPDGALWAGVSIRAGSTPDRGGIMRSTDMGQTWQRADEGFRREQGGGWHVNELKLARDGRIYAATERGVWRTTANAVAAEAPAAEPSRLGVSVRPNPSSGRVEIVLRGDGASAVRATVYDLQGRAVASVSDAPVSGERVVTLDTSAWALGVYVVRASAGGERASARLMVTR